MIFFTADTHFYHAGIISVCRRPFATVKNMNNALVRNWNSYVTDRDEVYILGDFMLGGNAKDANYTLGRMKGKNISSGAIMTTHTSTRAMRPRRKLEEMRQYGRALRE